MKLHWYVVYRKGSNSANQPMTFAWVPVFNSEAQNRGVAVRAALDAGVAYYNNQVMEARPESRCSNLDIQAAEEETAGLFHHMRACHQTTTQEDVK